MTNNMTQTNNEREALVEFKDAVKQLCSDFSSLQGNVYIKDVEASLDALCEQFIQSPISQNEQQESVGDGKYAIYFQDNWDGEADKYWTFAFKENGTWKSSETNNDLFQYVGDEILKIVPLYNQSELTSPPKQAIPEDVIKDAARYRWLREISRDPDESAPHCVVTKEYLEKGKPAKMISYLKFDEELDAEIDKAIIKAAPTNTEVGE